MAKFYVYLSTPTAVVELQIEADEADTQKYESGTGTVVKFGKSSFKRENLVAIIPEKEWQHRTWHSSKA